MLIQRPRRTRRSPAIRNLVREAHLQANHLISPLFVIEGHATTEWISSLPGVARYSLDHLILEVERQWTQGIRTFLLFSVVDAALKNSVGSEALNPHSLLIRAIDTIKQRFPDACVMSDIALDPFTDHGHDGVLSECGDVANDATVDILCEMARLHADAGVDFVAPSDMMDGRVGAIRKALDDHGATHCGIVAYTAKYASSLYGPYRSVMGSTLRQGDKLSYQLSPANALEAEREAALDEAEGADMLLVKPATLYLDIIQRFHQKTTLPIAAYHVSGEFAMVMAASERGWIDATQVLAEQLLSIRRAGASCIVTYAAGLWDQLEPTLRRP